MDTPTASTVSEARLAANRANARLSTGPRTPAGKSKSSQNALTHGLTGQVRIVTQAEEDTLANLLESLTTEYAPRTAIEQILVRRLALLAIRLERAAGAEAAKLDEWCHLRPTRVREMHSQHPHNDHDPVPPPDDPSQVLVKAMNLDDVFGNLHRYETTAHNQFHRTLRELDRLRKSRDANQPDPIEIETFVPANGPPPPLPEDDAAAIQPISPTPEPSSVDSPAPAAPLIIQASPLVSPCDPAVTQAPAPTPPPDEPTAPSVVSTANAPLQNEPTYAKPPTCLRPLNPPPLPYMLGNSKVRILAPSAK